MLFIRNCWLRGFSLANLFAREYIKGISAKVIRQCDKAELAMDWSSFMVPVFQSGGGNSITTSEIAHPIMIGANGLNPIFVEFANLDTQTLDRLAKIYEKLILELGLSPQMG